MEGTPACGAHAHTDLQLYCESNSSPTLHHGAALWAAVAKPRRVTQPQDKPQVRVMMGLHPPVPL